MEKTFKLIRGRCENDVTHYFRASKTRLIAVWKGANIWSEYHQQGPDFYRVQVEHFENEAEFMKRLQEGVKDFGTRVVDPSYQIGRGIL